MPDKERFNRMMDYLPEIYAETVEMQNLAKSQAPIFDRVEDAIEDFLNQAFIDTATWSIENWEKELEIIPDNMDIEIRRRKVKQKLNTINVANYPAIQRIINIYLVHKEAKLRPIKGDYAFEALIPIEEFADNVKAIENAVEEVKPAHVEFIPIGLGSALKNNIVISSKITTDVREYHRVNELCVGMPLIKSRKEVVL